MSFVLRGEPRGDEAHGLASVGVHHDDNAPHDIEADRDEPLLLLGRVVDRDGVGIEEHAFGIGEAHAMLAEVRLSLDRIPDRRHVCIIYAHAMVTSIVPFDGLTHWCSPAPNERRE